MSNPALNKLFHPEARLEFIQASEYYRVISPVLGRDFVENVELEGNDIVEFPELYPVVHPSGARRKTMRRFPYHLVYLVDPDAIYFIAVANVRRHPDYWVYRLDEPGRR
jgi:hypothetical protein